MAAVNQQWKETMKRLMLDLKELQNSPISVVSATPLEDNFREWHCNIVCDGLVVHVIIFIEENYPYAAPKAEFMPMGLRFSHGATRNGVKGTQLCMSLLSNYSDYHQEWKSEKNYGWSPGYTIQTLLLNLLAYVEDLKFRTPENEAMITDFTCPYCTHTTAVPYPPLVDAAGSSEMVASQNEQSITCYISKEIMDSNHKPDVDEELFGFGLEHYGSNAHKFLSSPCEFLTYGAFHNMKKTFGVVHNSMKEEISDFLPLFIHSNHGACIKTQFETTIAALSTLFRNRAPKKTTTETLTTDIINVLPNLMATTLEDFVDALEGSDNLLTGFFAFHRLFLWAVDTYPELQEKIDEEIEIFLANEDHRCKKFSPYLEEWIMLLSVSSKYSWHDVAEAFLSEIWKRDVKQYVEDDGLLGDLDTDMKYRIENTFTRTKYSRKRLATQIAFLNTAMPPGMGRDDVIRRYDNNLGYPTTDMVHNIREACENIRDAKSYADLFAVLNLPPINDEQLFIVLLTSVKSAIKTTGYHGTGRKRTGGWRDLRLMQEKKRAQLKAASKMKSEVDTGEKNDAELPETSDCASDSHAEKMDVELEGAKAISESRINEGLQAMDVEENENRDKFEQILVVGPIAEVKELRKLQRDLSLNLIAHTRKRRLTDTAPHKWSLKKARSCAVF